MILRSVYTKCLDYSQRALMKRNILKKFIFYIIALESLFSTDRNTPIRATLADYVSVLIESPTKRLDTHKRIKKLYDIRSSLFHSGQSAISKESIEDLELYLVRTLVKIFQIVRDSEPSSDKVFHKRILKMKIGAV